MFLGSRKREGDFGLGFVFLSALLRLTPSLPLWIAREEIWRGGEGDAVNRLF
jgi:hypothetical protein